MYLDLFPARELLLRKILSILLWASPSLVWLGVLLLGKLFLDLLPILSFQAFQSFELSLLSLSLELFLLHLSYLLFAPHTKIIAEQWRNC
jgi:hypothetical protein